MGLGSICACVEIELQNFVIFLLIFDLRSKRSIVNVNKAIPTILAHLLVPNLSLRIISEAASLFEHRYVLLICHCSVVLLIIMNKGPVPFFAFLL